MARSVYLTEPAAQASITTFASASLAGDVTVLFQTDGNWTTHGARPRALLLSHQVNLAEATEVCTAYGEGLQEDCSLFGHDFAAWLFHQNYMGTITKDTLFWTNCISAITPGLSTQNGSSVALSQDAGVSSALLCTNTAPPVHPVDTDRSVFPRINGTTFDGLRDHMASCFMGIPYAQPTLGS